jgi:hypothetical protein
MDFAELLLEAFVIGLAGGLGGCVALGLVFLLGGQCARLGCWVVRKVRGW